MSTTIRLRSLLRFTIILTCWLQAQHSVLAAENVTVLDTDPSIVYLPPDLWFASTSLCSTCLNPGGSTSFHEAIHPPAAPDSDDHTSSTTTSHPPTASKTQTTTSTASSDPDSHKSTPGGKSRRRSLVRRFLPRLDADDAGFVDSTVSMALNFTGTAVFLFATQPPNVLNVNETSSNTNLTFFLDNAPVSKMQPSNSTNPNYLSGQLVFSQSGLADGPHQLVVQVGQNSTFIFERLIYTMEAQANPSTSSIQQSAPSPSVDPKVQKHNIATFGGAVGGSVGVLALFSLGLALSIIRRRYLAAKREQRDHESLHTNASDDSPHMVGPAPFMPRYFPDTVIPSEPPTYMAALASNNNNSTLLAALPLAAFGSTQRSYADIPPSVPPPPLEDMIPPPPPFPVAISTPPLRQIESTSEEEGALPPSITGAERSSHSAISVGTESLTSAPAPELVPLLQSVDAADTRPRVGVPKPTETTDIGEDTSQTRVPSGPRQTV